MPRREFNDDHTPRAYLITFRSYGTWMHGDERGSIDRHHRRFGTPALPTSPRREEIEKRLLKQGRFGLIGPNEERLSLASERLVKLVNGRFGRLTSEQTTFIASLPPTTGRKELWLH